MFRIDILQVYISGIHTYIVLRIERVNYCDTIGDLSTGCESQPPMQIGALDNPAYLDMYWRDRDTFSPILARLYVRICYGEDITDQDLDHLTYNECVHLLIDHMQKHIYEEDPPQSLEMLWRLIDLDETFSSPSYVATRIQSNSPDGLVALRWALGFFVYEEISRKNQSDFINTRVGQSIQISYALFHWIVWELTKERLLYLNKVSARRALYNPYSRISPTHKTGFSDTDLSHII